MTATAPEDRTIPFKDLIKDSISHSYNEMQIQHQILQGTVPQGNMNPKGAQNNFIMHFVPSCHPSSSSPQEKKNHIHTNKKTMILMAYFVPQWPVSYYWRKKLKHKLDNMLPKF
ncbi:hypothetical protein HAX54_049882 [Datura stramonium]|uniref:Uncharacterized protein n=1 Tax=Datura stramonium TaxID=4076 RepID=A0ABS8SW86_DATST|nr:hypothetical protein [Datura stramonium]